MKRSRVLGGIALALFAACEKPAASPIEPETAKHVAPSAKPFEQLTGCRLIPNRWNDGDSFHVRLTDGREIVARLYFVDTIESETAYRDRIAEQAAYFGISMTEAATVPREASAFTAKRLAAPFTIWTRWRDALGRSAGGRVYVVAMAGGVDLNESLVETGLARIYGTRTPLPDGRDLRTYLTNLKAIETKAKAAKRGAWNSWNDTLGHLRKRHFAGGAKCLARLSTAASIRAR